MRYVISQSAADFFTWNATTGVPKPKSAPSTSTSSCDISVETGKSPPSQASVPLHDRIDNPPLLAAPTVTLTPLTNLVSNVPYPSSQTTSRVCPKQLWRTMKTHANGRRRFDQARYRGGAPVTVIAVERIT